MKYVSLIELMRTYGCFIKEHHNMIEVDRRIIQNNYNRNTSYKLFTIEHITVDESETESESEQVLNSLRFNGQLSSTTLLTIPPHIPPILEIEYLRMKLDLADEIMDVLEQLGYMMILYILNWKYHMIYFSNQDLNISIEDMVSDGIIVEMEDLEDTAKIINHELPLVRMPKIRSWQHVWIYAVNMSDVLEACEIQSTMFKEIYFHLPVMLSMFMINYFKNKLNDWSKSRCLGFEHKMKEWLTTFDNYQVREEDKYTYGITTSITRKDVELVNTVFKVIYDKIQKLNANIGLISFYDYQHIRGPETKQASVQLSSMHINWHEEMERVKNETEADDTEFFN